MEKNNSRPLLTGRTNNGSRHRVRPPHGGNGKTPGGLLNIQKVKEEASKVLGKERWDPLLTVLWRKPQKMAFKNSICFVTDRSFAADSGLLQPTESAKTTPQRKPIIMARVWVDDDKIKSDYNFKKKTWVLRMRGETERWDVRHQWRRENQDQHKAHETRHLKCECARSILVSSCCRHNHSLKPSRLKSVCLHSSHPCMKWASLFDFELSIPSNFLLFLFSFNLHQLLLPFNFHEDT